MVLCEAFLMSIMLLLGIYTSYTDLKSGIIPNKTIIYAMSLGLIINIIYLGIYCREYLLVYFINLLIISILAVGLYAFHFWSAGDSKLLICISFLFPARLYEIDSFSFAPGVNAIIYIFLIAYVYIIVDSIIQFSKKRKYYLGQLINKKTIKQFLINYLISFLYLRVLNETLRIFLKDIYFSNQITVSFLGLFVAILIYNNKFFKKWYAITLAAIINILLLRHLTFNPSILISAGILLIALILRFILNGYNYQEIDTNTVTKGMILSYATVMKFNSSRVAGLPKTTYEDMRSRLNDEEVDAIKRWRISKNGCEKITIVRKMPFAIFIVLGEIIFFIVRIRG